MNNQEELIETEYNRAVNLWNETYSECKLVDLKGKPLSVEPMFDICLDIFASKCKKVLDFGCGTGDIIFQCYEFVCLPASQAIGTFVCQTAECVVA